MSFDMDQFYSQDDVATWQKIIGNDLHYHYGYFTANEDLETGLRQTVRNFYPDIAHGASILDVGCGWGGPAQMLMHEKDCSVKGITISKTQVSHCQKRGIDVCCLNLETGEIPGGYEVAFMLEVLSHIRNKVGVLRKLRSCAKRLILSSGCIANSVTSKTVQTFGGSMVLCSPTQLCEIVTSAGWHIIKKRNRRFQSLRTNELWGERLTQVYGDKEPPGQLAHLKSVVVAAAKNPALWARNNPLIDIIAE